LEEVERFAAEGDNGQRYTVVLWARLTPFTSSKGVTTWHRGGQELRLLDGREVFPKEPGVFEIDDTEEIIRKVKD
jgi:hypothetical protein